MAKLYKWSRHEPLPVPGQELQSRPPLQGSHPPVSFSRGPGFSQDPPSRRNSLVRTNTLKKPVPVDRSANGHERKGSQNDRSLPPLPAEAAIVAIEQGIGKISKPPVVVDNLDLSKGSSLLDTYGHAKPTVDAMTNLIKSGAAVVVGSSAGISNDSKALHAGWVDMPVPTVLKTDAGEREASANAVSTFCFCRVYSVLIAHLRSRTPYGHPPGRCRKRNISRRQYT
jgi:hypothetical protein